jgi:2-polyprenyl-6-methoxyphenol hydroxylase-like FAD-dependent oxidoreductase
MATLHRVARYSPRHGAPPRRDRRSGTRGRRALSLLLARSGFGVTLIERERDFERAFRGEALMPTGLDALSAMGVRAKVDALPWRPLEVWEIYLDRRPIMQVREPSAELGSRALRVVPQAHLLSS